MQTQVTLTILNLLMKTVRNLVYLGFSFYYFVTVN
jgi:hypothetical protein